jgi:hypothetical protein
VCVCGDRGCGPYGEHARKATRRSDQRANAVHDVAGHDIAGHDSANAVHDVAGHDIAGHDIAGHDITETEKKNPLLLAEETYTLR